MAQIKFGVKQIKNPTPASWSSAINLFTVIAGTFIAWLPTANYIPSKQATIIQSILGLLLAIANGLKPLVGVETSQKSVPIDDVASMNTPSKP